MMSDFRAQEAGLRIVELFGLKIDKKTGYYQTSYGGKTAIGVARCVEQVMQKANATMNELLEENECP